MKSYSSREILKMLQDDEWYEIACDGDHHQLKHPTKKGAFLSNIEWRILLCQKTDMLMLLYSIMQMTVFLFPFQI